MPLNSRGSLITHPDAIFVFAICAKEFFNSHYYMRSRFLGAIGILRAAKIRWRTARSPLIRRTTLPLGLEQELPADAGVDILFLADLKRILEHDRNRAATVPSSWRPAPSAAGSIWLRMLRAWVRPG
jgi:hypothetical protein